VLLTGAVIAWLAHRSATDSTRALSDSLFREVSSHAVQHTRGFVLRAVPLLESLRRLADRGLALDDSDRLAGQLLAFLEANPGLTWVSYGDEAGSFTGVYRTPEGGLRVNQSRVADGHSPQVEHDVQPDGSWANPRKNNDSGYDPRTRPFYRKVRQEGRLVWLPPYLFFGQDIPGITCAAPVTGRDGHLRGVLTVDFDLLALSDFVAGQAVSPHSRVFLFTQGGELLAHPDRSLLAAKRRADTPLPTLSDIGDPLVESFRQQLPTTSLEPATDEQVNLFEIDHAGVPYLCSATTFRVGDDLSWVVGVIAPKSDFLAGVWRGQTLSLIAATVALLVAVLLAFLLARLVSGPVQSLIAFMRKVGAGDLEARADLGGSREFRQLSAALNGMIADLRDRLRLRHSLQVAMEVQQRLLPKLPPRVPGLDLAGHSTYCDETGGDYYDYLILEEVAPSGVLIALGDVMGHGVAAALVMAGARAVLHNRASTALGLADLIGHLNRLLAADHEGARFMTMHLSIVDPRAGSFRWVSAGHDPALLYDPTTGNFEELAGADLPLGIVEETDFEEHCFSSLRPQQIILVGTDGVWEMPNATGEQFGKDRLREAIRSTANGSAAEIVQAIYDRLTTFRGDHRTVDDVTFVVIKILEVGTQTLGNV
jgi:serine phosphatase RsbU (regulator of sigma subunit)